MFLKQLQNAVETDTRGFHEDKFYLLCNSILKHFKKQADETKKPVADNF